LNFYKKWKFIGFRKMSQTGIFWGIFVAVVGDHQRPAVAFGRGSVSFMGVQLLDFCWKPQGGLIFGVVQNFGRALLGGTIMVYFWDVVKVMSP
jgi:hypothetical protein